ncbi:MAG TPA: J domain-containing protein [Chitinophagales bacterium]|nr:J domain-containing protein [Chitinophagales bacterium]
MEYKDYYGVLGVSKTASPDDIRKAFRRLAVKFHPDKNPGDKKAEERFKEINEANEVLGDPEKRKKYDLLGSNWKQYEQAGSRGGGSPFDQTHYEGNPSEFFGHDDGFSDFFSAFFGGGTQSGTRSRRHGGARTGPDYQAETELSLEEAYHGTTRIVNLHQQKIRISTKAGAYDGQLLRIPGKGAPGGGGGPAGDLYVRLRVAPHPVFKRVDNDLVQTKSVDLYTAVLGGKTTVETITGHLSVNVPAGTQPGQTLRLRGKGMPVYGSDSHGDMLVKIKVVLPKTLTDEQRRLFEKLRQTQP